MFCCFLVHGGHGGSLVSIVASWFKPSRWLGHSSVQFPCYHFPGNPLGLTYSPVTCRTGLRVTGLWVTGL